MTRIPEGDGHRMASLNLRPLGDRVVVKPLERERLREALEAAAARLGRLSASPRLVIIPCPDHAVWLTSVDL